MTTVLRFDGNAAKQLVATYMTPDLVAQRQQVIEFLSLEPGARVLDVGTGPGFLASSMADIVGETGEVYGVDISDELLAFAAENHAHQKHLKFLRAEALKLPFSTDSFDVAVVTQVLEYIPDVPAALRELHRVLRPGGRVLVLDTDWDSIVWHSRQPERMNRILKLWDAHLHDPYLPRTLASKLREAGFGLHEQKVLPLFNPVFSEDAFSNKMIDLIGNFVQSRPGIAPDEVEAWKKDLRDLGVQGSYFFSLNRYVFIASKMAD